MEGKPNAAPLNLRCEHGIRVQYAADSRQRAHFDFLKMQGAEDSLGAICPVESSNGHDIS